MGYLISLRGTEFWTVERLIFEIQTEPKAMFWGEASQCLYHTSSRVGSYNFWLKDSTCSAHAESADHGRWGSLQLQVSKLSGNRSLSPHRGPGAAHSGALKGFNISAKKPQIHNVNSSLKSRCIPPPRAAVPNPHLVGHPGACSILQFGTAQARAGFPNL